MAGKRRITGFTRFILVLIILIPSVYVGSHLITGEEMDLKKLFNFNKSEAQTESVTEVTKEDNDQLKKLNWKIEELEEDVKKLEEEVESLKNQIK